MTIFPTAPNHCTNKKTHTKPSQVVQDYNFIPKERPNSHMHLITITNSFHTHTDNLAITMHFPSTPNHKSHYRISINNQKLKSPTHFQRHIPHLLSVNVTQQTIIPTINPLNHISSIPSYHAATKSDQTDSQKTHQMFEFTHYFCPVYLPLISYNLLSLQPNPSHVILTLYIINIPHMQQ